MNLQELVNKIKERFSVVELKELFFRLTVDYEDLPGTTRQEKIIELVKYCERHDKLEILVNHCSELRPHVKWVENTPEFPEIIILSLLKKHNDDWCKVLASDGDIRYLDATTTPRGLFQAKQNAEDEIECMYDDGVEACSFINLDLVHWQMISSNKFKVTVDEFWEDHYGNQKRLKTSQRNIYEVVFINNSWLIDCCDTLEQIDT